jgi:CheY-like chemotaxis protein
MRQLEQELGTINTPIVVYTGAELTQAEETTLKRMTKSIILKKDARSLEHLLDNTALFLHRVEANLPEEKRLMLTSFRNVDVMLAGKKILLVDDDIRNIFATTSILERHQINVLFAENGKIGIKLLQENPDIGVVLMDIMMPEMDGYETIRQVRRMPGYENLPIIALTAKAMVGDREKALDVGASDYITKPIDTDHLFSLLRIWLSK